MSSHTDKRTAGDGPGARLANGCERSHKLVFSPQCHLDEEIRTMSYAFGANEELRYVEPFAPGYKLHCAIFCNGKAYLRKLLRTGTDGDEAIEVLAKARRRRAAVVGDYGEYVLTDKVFLPELDRSSFGFDGEIEALHRQMSDVCRAWSYMTGSFAALVSNIAQYGYTREVESARCGMVVPHWHMFYGWDAVRTPLLLGDYLQSVMRGYYMHDAAYTDDLRSWMLTSGLNVMGREEFIPDAVWLHRGEVFSSEIEEEKKTPLCSEQPQWPWWFALPDLAEIV